VELTPSELDRVLIFNVAQLAKSRQERGLKLNKPEAVALISHAVIEAARDGNSHAQALQAGLSAISDSDLLPGVGSMLSGIAVEAVFDDGRRLVVVDFVTNDLDTPGKVTRLDQVLPNRAKDLTTATVVNESKIQISVTTHMHFFEVNPRLKFDREATYGKHLFIPAGEHVDFPPGIPVDVELVPISGDRVMIGFAGLVDGPLDEPGMKERAIERARELGYLGTAK
jgi:urease subunit gamma/beta